MGDGVTIPRSYAGSIGAADVTNCIKRKVIVVGMGTTGKLLGNSTTGFNFQRGQILEKVTLSCLKAGTTACTMSIMKNGSTAASSTMGTTAGWHNKEVTPTIAAYASTDNLWLYTASFGAATKIRVVLEFREAVE